MRARYCTLDGLDRLSIEDVADAADFLDADEEAREIASKRK